MSETADAIVIGAGIVGAACAAALASDGLSVIVVECGATGGGATAAAMGHLVLMDDSPAQLALTRYSRDRWNQLAPQLPREVEFEARGTLWIAANELELAIVHGKHAAYSRHGLRAEVLDSARLEAAEPNLRKGLAGGLFVPDDAVIQARAAAEWLLKQSGAVVKKGRVERILDGAVVLEGGSTLTGAAIVCAAGTGTTALIPGLPLQPRKGHLALTGEHPGFIHHQLVELGYLGSAHGDSKESVAFNIQPRANGQVLIGSSRQYGPMLADVEQPILMRMMERACQYVPGLATLPIVRTWTGFRAATPDKLPLIGRWPRPGSLYLATGHEGLGITTSLGTALLLADLVARRETAIDPTPYAPARFATS